MTSITRIMLSAAALQFAAGAAVAEEVGTITLFGETYRVDRFDYAADVVWPDPVNPGFEIQLFQSEGSRYVGDNEILISMDDGDDFLSIQNFVVKVGVDVDEDGFPTGIGYVCTVVESDEATFPGWPLDPSGLTIGPNNELVVCDSEDEDGQFLKLFDQSWMTCGLSDLLDSPAGCLADNNGQFCGIPVNPSLGDLEDAVYDAATDAYWTVDEDGPFLGLFDATTGFFSAQYPIGGQVDPAVVGGAKGVAILDAPAAGGVAGATVLVSFDADGPALQTFDLDGNFMATEFLTESSDPASPPLLDLGDCGFPLAIESISVDNETGRLFLLNEGEGFTCNFLFILTPITPPPGCPGDLNGDLVVNSDDLNLLLAAFGQTDAGDLNDDGVTDSTDLNILLAAFGDVCV